MPKSSDSVTDLPDGIASQERSELVVSGSLEDQLRDLYTQRQELQRALGTADSRAIIAMVRSLEAQLRDLYGLLRGKSGHLDDNAN